MRKVRTLRGYEPPHDARRYFDHQVKALVRRGYLRATGVNQREFYPDLGALAPVAMEILKGYDWRENRIPFLIVNRNIPIREQLEMSVFRHREVRCEIQEEQVRHGEEFEEKIAESWYIATDIEFREDLWDVSPRDAHEVFKAEGRLGLNIFEGIALNIHRPREGFTALLLGSTVQRTHVPNITLSEESISLHANRPGMHFPKWIAVSCRARIQVPQTK